MTLLAQTSILSALVAIAIFVSSIFLRKRRSRLQSHFAYFNLNIFLLMIAFILLSREGYIHEVGLRLSLLFSLGLPVTGLRFFALFLPDLEKSISRTLNVTYPLTIIFGGIIITPLYDNLTFLIVYSIYVLSIFALCFLLIFLHYRSSDNLSKKARLRLVFMGGFTVVALMGLDLISYSLDWPYLFLGNLFVALYNYYLLQLITTARVIDPSELLAKGSVLGALSVLIAGIYWVLTVWVDTKQWGPFFFSGLVASIVILIFHEPLKNEVESRVAERFFSQKQELKLLLEKLRRNLINIIDLDHMSRLLMDTLQNSNRTTHASFYLLREDGSGFERKDYFGEAPLPFIDFGRNASFIQYLEENLSPIVKQDLEFQFTTSAIFSWKQEGEGIREEERLLEIIRTLDQMKAEVCLPCISSEGKILGLINLQDERFGSSYSQAEISLMMMVSAQAAITLENSRLFEKIKERERLAALGEMSAGLAHEIRNPLGAIKGAAQLLQPEHLDESEQEMIDIILEEVDRLNSVVCQFLDYARPMKSGFTVTDLNKLLQRTIQLLGADAPDNIEILLNLDEKLPPIFADAEKLKQVFLNLIRNAIEAMPDGGRLTIESHLVGEEDSNSVELIFADEGVGIAPDVMKNIFIPFYTSKDKGTGLGLSICQRIVEHHNGHINLQSTLGKGTKFIIRLPIKREP